MSRSIAGRYDCHEDVVYEKEIFPMTQQRPTESVTPPVSESEFKGASMPDGRTVMGVSNELVSHANVGEA